MDVESPTECQVEWVISPVEEESEHPVQVDLSQRIWVRVRSQVHVIINRNLLNPLAGVWPLPLDTAESISCILYTLQISGLYNLLNKLLYKWFIIYSIRVYTVQYFTVL